MARQEIRSGEPLRDAGGGPWSDQPLTGRRHSRRARQRILIPKASTSMRVSSPYQQLEKSVPATVRPVRRPWYRVAMHWVRRIHLYSGLFMFPWVMLYGITALLFNHPGAFPDRVQHVLTREDFVATPLEQLP